MKMNILIIDDEKSQREIIADILKDAGYSVDIAENGIQGIRKFSRHYSPVVLTDLKMPGKDGLDVVKEVKELSSEVQVIIMTAFGTIPGAVNAIKTGAYDYLTKPFKKDDLLQVVARASEKYLLLAENNRLKEEISSRYQYGNLIGKSNAMRKIYKMIERISNIDATVLITGESGTGKELVAKAVHYSGIRKDAPFIAINCGAIPENLIESELFGHERGAFTGATKSHAGKFEQAQNGTILLDEIGVMKLDLQVRLLRVLQEKKVERLGSNKSIDLNVRIIAATNDNLQDKIKNREFREDLYHRLNLFSIELPPLRQRKEDIPLLAQSFITKYTHHYKKNNKVLTAEALKKLEAYNFPGNVRELENIIEKTIILTDHQFIKKSDLMITEKNTLKTTAITKNEFLPDIEFNLIKDALTWSNGSIKKAAIKLGISYKTMQYRMKKFKLDKMDYK